MGKEKIDKNYQKKADKLFEDFMNQPISLNFANRGMSNRVRAIRDDQDKMNTILDGISENSLEEIRNESLKLYNRKGVYWRNVQFIAGLPSLDYVIVPVFATSEEKKDRIKKAYEKVESYCNDILEKSQVRNIVTSVIRDGVYYGHERSDSSNYYMQKLDNDLCRKSRLIVKGIRAVEFNFSYFDDFENHEELEREFQYFPNEFKALYNQYLSEKEKDIEDAEWQILDVDKAIGIWLEEDTPSIPLFARNFSDLLEIEEYYANLRTINDNEARSILQQKLPYNEEDGVTPALLMQAKQFHGALTSVAPPGTSVVTAPFDISEIKVGKNKSDREAGIDKIKNKIDQASGISPFIFENAQNVSGINANINYNARIAFSILEKLEYWLRKRLAKFPPNKYRFKVEFLRITDADREMMFQFHSQLLAVGGNITPLISATGIDVSSYIGLLDLENDILGIKDKLQLTQSIHTANTTDIDNKGGRPEEKDSETGEEAKDKGTNEERSNE